MGNSLERESKARDMFEISNMSLFFCPYSCYAKVILNFFHSKSELVYMLRNWLHKIGIVSIELLVIASLLFYVYQKNNLTSIGQIIPVVQNMISGRGAEFANQMKGDIITKQIFPKLQNETKRVFNWEYRNEKYTLTENLDQGAYDFYKAQPKVFSYSGELQSNWADEYYGMFLKSAIGDESIVTLAKDLQNLGKVHKLSDDQIVDLTLSFVQAIAYDDAKAKNILAKKGTETVLYPYETLFEQKGVCSDKSLLAIAILRQMGYGAAIFAFEDDNHTAIGIACPKEYSTYGSGYCYGETTSVGNKIGIIPSFDATSNKTVGAIELSAIDSSQSEQANLKQLGHVTIYQQTSGREYDEIAETRKIIAEIDSLKKSIESMLPELQSQKKNLKNSENNLDNLKKNLEKYKNDQNVEKYNSLVGEFNDLVKKYKNDTRNYNEKVSLYNKTIARYNVLIKQ